MDGGHWAMIAVPPERVPATAEEQPYATAAVALNNLAQTLADLGRLEEAEAVARSAVAIGGATLPAAQSTLAQIVEKRSKARP